MERQTVMVSSTVVDLPEHRGKVRDACLAADYFPKMMEYLPARDENAIESSMALVDEAQVFVGVYAFRYGHVPKGHDKSITEMEVDRAQERGIPILPFLMDPAHPVTADMVEVRQTAARKLQRLKDRLCAGRGRVFFKSADDLKGQVESALHRLTIRRQAEALAEARQTIMLMKLVMADAVETSRQRRAGMTQIDKRAARGGSASGAQGSST
jgi:hypothetical protein